MRIYPPGRINIRHLGLKKNFIQTNYLITLGILMIVVLSFGYLWIKDNLDHYNKEIQYIESLYLDDKKENVKENTENTLNYIRSMEESVDLDIRYELKAKGEEAFQLTDAVYENLADTATNEEINAIIADTLRQMDFDNEQGYYIIYRMDGLCLLNTSEPGSENTFEFLTYRDKAGHYPLKSMIETLKNDNSFFYEYYKAKPGSDIQELNVSYIREFADQDLFLGCVMYFDTVQLLQQKKAIRTIRENHLSNQEPYRIFNSSGYCLLDPFSPVNEGKILEDINDPETYEIVQKSLFLAEAGEASYQFWGDHDSSKTENRQIIYTTYFPEWDWIIIAEDSLMDIEYHASLIKSQLKDSIFMQIRRILLLMVISMGTAVFLFHKMSQHIRHTIELFMQFLKKASKENILIDTRQIHYDEFKLLSQLANSMVKNLKSTQQELNQSRTFYQHILDTSPIIFYVKDEKGVFIQVNKAFEMISSTNRDEVIGLCSSDMFHQVDSAEWDDIDNRVRQTGMEESHEIKLMVKGEQRTFLKYYSPVYRNDEKTVDYVGWAIDITDRKEIESRLEESELRLKKIISCIDTGIIIIDPETRRVTDANPAAVRMFGATRKRLIGQLCHNHICPREYKNCPLLDEHLKIDKTEASFITSTGEAIPIMKTIVPITLKGEKSVVGEFL